MLSQFANRVRFFGPGALLIMLALGACKRIEKDTPPAVMQAIAGVRDQHCPDRRLCVFDVGVIMRGANLRLVGEMTDAAAKAQLVQAVKAAVPDFKVEEEIRLLPDESLGEERFGLVRVSTANLRAKPVHSAELVHQLLMGSSVSLLKREKGWCYVQTEDGYVAWVPSGSLRLGSREMLEEWTSADLVACKVMKAIVHNEPAEQALPISSLVLGCIARRVAEVHDAVAGPRKKWLQIALPDGRTGFVEREQMAGAASVFPPMPLPVTMMVAQVKRMLGIPYLWGGSTVDGFDCSGFTQMMFRMNGMRIMRDASQQARQGEPVDPGENFERLQPGDLLFFGEKPGKITHVAMALGGARYIHASDFVQINSLNVNDSDYVEYRRKTFQFARRYFASTPSVSRHGKL